MGTRADRDAAFADFAAVATPRLFRSALVMCGDWHLAEDLVQTALMKLYVVWPRVSRGSGDPHAYTRTVLLRSYLAHKRLRRSREVPSDRMGDEADVVHDPGAWVEIAEALQGLKPLDRAVLMLRYYEESSVAETAALVGVSQTSVRSRASRARAWLRTEFSESGEEKRDD